MERRQYEIFIASGTNIKMKTTCNKHIENDKQNHD